MFRFTETSKNVNPSGNIFLALAAMLASSLFFPIDALAQSGAGSIQGTVQDATAAALPGSVVHVVNTKTGVTNDSTANSAGFYSVQGLFSGSYTVTFTAKAPLSLPFHFLRSSSVRSTASIGTAVTTPSVPLVQATGNPISG